MTCGDEKFKTVPGACWLIPSGEKNSWVNTSMGETVLIEAFSPPREDFLGKANVETNAR